MFDVELITLEDLKTSWSLLLNGRQILSFKSSHRNDVKMMELLPQNVYPFMRCTLIMAYHAAFIGMLGSHC